MTAISARAAALRKDRAVKDVFKSEQAEERAEQKRIADTLALERQLADRDTRPVAFSQLRDEWKHLRAEAAAETDSSKRRVARPHHAWPRDGSPRTNQRFRLPQDSRTSIPSTRTHRTVSGPA